MKKVIIIIIILSFTNGFSQFYEYKNCSEAKRSAEKDFNNGNISLRLYGLLDNTETDYEFEKFHNVYLYSKYSIKVEYMGCLTSKNGICYVKKTDDLIEKKFGKNFFSEVRKETEKLYKETNEFEKSKLLNLSKAYFDGLESNPKFLGNDKILIDYLKSKTKNTECEFILIINTKGKVVEISNTKLLINAVEKSKMITVINNLGDWFPGYIYGIQVKSIFFAYFEQSKKE